MAKPILLSGIRPTGRLHLGNYLGALKHFVELQNSGRYQCYFFIADLHSLNTDFDPKNKSRETLELVADYLAAGLDPKKSTIFVQSHVQAHTELANILSNITYMGELSRMTQFKDLSKGKKNINAGLFIYPILMTSDIIIYDPKFVPVGEDQLQHLELVRELVRRFNQKFGKIFTEPKPLLTEAPRIMSLIDPKKKMSKSQQDGCLFLDDSPAVIERKIMRATTDSGKEIKHNPKKKPGISNLLLIYRALSGKKMPKAENYSGFKKELADLVSNYFADYRKNKAALIKQATKLEKVAREGSKKANQVAEKKMTIVKKKLGLLDLN